MPKACVIFDRDIPSFAEANFWSCVREMLGRSGLALTDIERFACHPGGAKVGHGAGARLVASTGNPGGRTRGLADCGNMSAPTVFFVLERGDKVRTSLSHPVDGHGAGSREQRVIATAA